MLNQLSKFSPHLTDETKLLRELLSSKNQWVWGSAQQESFDKIKATLNSTQVLAMYNAAYMKPAFRQMLPRMVWEQYCYKNKLQEN